MANNLSTFLQSKIDLGEFPSAVYLVAERGRILIEDSLGYAVVVPERIKASQNTIYDLASLTKPLVIGLLSAKLIENGRFSLGDSVSRYLPGFEREDKKEITILNLLIHTSGLRPWKPFYLFNRDRDIRENVLGQITADPSEVQVNSKVIYSDYNFLALGFLIENIYQLPLDEIARRELFDPLNLVDTCFNPPKSLAPRIAASETGNAYEKQIANDLYPEIQVPESAFRTRTIWGEVHDNNCHFLDGVAGHAGIFSTAGETLKLAQQFLPESTSILHPETCGMFRKNFSRGLNQARSVSFQLAATKESTAGGALTDDSFGHLGFTGTSLWIEPSTQRIFILLTNRTHNHQLPFADLKETRQNFHRKAVGILDRN